MKFIAFLFFLSLFACKKGGSETITGGRTLQFSSPRPVALQGYSRDAMEPFVSRDGQWLFFNNRNDPDTNTNICYSKRLNDSTFQYQGEVKGVNSPALDGVASMDLNGNFYFVSTRSYLQSLSSIYQGVFKSDSVSGVNLVGGVSEKTPGKMNFDEEISRDGQTLYFTDGEFDSGGQLVSSDLAIGIKTASGFQRLANSATLLKNINTFQLEYAAGISDDELTLFFTRLPNYTIGVIPRIFYATRAKKTDPFGIPTEITQWEGFVEAATVSGDSLVYFHKMENNRYSLYYSHMQ